MSDDVEVAMRKHNILRLLRDNILEVRFVKKNGEYRQMKCTLDPNRGMPITEAKETDHVTPEGNIAVWDVEKNGWRSFRVASVYDYFIVRSEI